MSKLKGQAKSEMSKHFSMMAKTAAPEREKREVDLFLAASMLPVEANAAFMEACDAAPAVADRESRPDWFLLQEASDMHKASISLATYWKRRKTVFGSRFTLPLGDASGNGAMTLQDLELLTKGFLSILPQDKAGRPVVLIDYSRRLQHFEAGAIMRAQFFVHYQIVAANPKALPSVVIARIPLSIFHMTMKGYVRDPDQLNFFPIRTTDFHVCMDSPSAHSNQESSLIALCVKLQCLGREIGKNIWIHAGTSPSDFTSKLSEHGMLCAGLPESLGGTCHTTDMFQNWQEKRQDEDALDPADALLDQVTQELIAASESSDPDSGAQEMLTFHHGRTQFALGVLSMMQEEQNCSLRALLQDPATVELLLPWVGVPHVSLAKQLQEELALGLAEIAAEDGLNHDTEAASAVADSLLDSLVAELDGASAVDGPSVLSSDSPENQALLKQEVYEALKRLDCDKNTVTRALQVVPGLVDTESNPLKFLKYENYDAEAAARLLASWWSYREEFFGDRAFLPLFDLSGNGALTKADIALLHTGLVSSLPADRQGRAIQCCAFQRIPERWRDSDLAHQRIRFYMMNSMVRDHPDLETTGIVGIYVLTTPDLFMCPLVRSAAIINCAMPFSLNELHICCLPPPAARKHFEATVVPVMLHQCSEGKFDLHIHVADSPSEMGKKILPFFEASSIPDTLGGAWSYTQLGEWIEWQTLDQDRQDLAAAREENDQLAKELMKQMSTPTMVLPESLQFCLGVLSVLEEEQGRKLSELIEDEGVVEILDGLMGGTETKEDGASATMLLDVLADRIAKQLVNRGDVNTKDLQDQLLTGQDESCFAMVDSALGSLVFPQFGAS